MESRLILSQKLESNETDYLQIKDNYFEEKFVNTMFRMLSELSEKYSQNPDSKSDTYSVEKRRFDNFIGRLKDNEYISVEKDYGDLDYFIFLSDIQAMMIINIKDGNANTDSDSRDAYSQLSARFVNISNGCLLTYGRGYAYNHYMKESYPNAIVRFFCDYKGNALSDTYYCAEDATSVPETIDISSIIKMITFNQLIETIEANRTKVKSRVKTENPDK